MKYYINLILFIFLHPRVLDMTLRVMYVNYREHSQLHTTHHQCIFFIIHVLNMSHLRHTCHVTMNIEIQSVNSNSYFIYVLSIFYQITNLVFGNRINFYKVPLFYGQSINFISYHFELKQGTSSINYFLVSHLLYILLYFILFIYLFFLHTWVKIKK